MKGSAPYLVYSDEGALGMSARRRFRVLMAIAAAGVAVLVTGAAGAWATVTPPSGPTAGGTSVTIDLPPNRFVQVTEGNYHTLGLTEDGVVWAWGDNDYGQLGDGTMTDSLVPVRVQLPAGTVVTQVEGGAHSSYAVTSTGAVYSWGGNAVGELGDGTTIGRSLPVLVALPSGVTVSSVHADYDQDIVLTATVFAITTTGSLYGWGYNNGKFGDGTTAASPTPVLLTLPGGVAALGAATSQTGAYVLGADGMVYSAGATTVLGLLGRGGTAQSWAPVVTTSVPVGVTFTAVAAGRQHGLALGTDGLLYSWGNNALGRLGVGSTSGSSALAVPVSMPPGVLAAAIAAYNDSSYFLTSDGTAYAWGQNSYGQFGDGTTDPRSAPGSLAIPVPTGRSIVQLSAGQYATAIRLSDGSLLAAGRNLQGELGDGTAIQRTSFVSVLSPLVATSVTFDGLPAAAFADLGTTVEATTPAHAAGPVDVSVTTQTRAGGAGPTHFEAGGFTYLAPAVPPVITSGDPPDGQVGEPYTHTVTTAGTGPIGLTAAGVLPPGLSFDPTSGTLSGTPTAVGNYFVTVTATNSAGEASGIYTISIVAASTGPTPGAPGPRSISGETTLAYSGMLSSAPLVALLGGALAAFGAGLWTLRSVLRKRAG